MKMLKKLVITLTALAAPGASGALIDLKTSSATGIAILQSTNFE
jgi:hypothetical protein